MKLDLFHSILNKLSISNLIAKAKRFNRKGDEIKPRESFAKEAVVASHKREAAHVAIQTARMNTNGLPLGVSRAQAKRARYYRKHKDELAELPKTLRLQIETTIKRLRECSEARAQRRAKVAA